jgi:hypothetical protein
LGDLRAALGLLNSEGITLAVGKGYTLVDAFLDAGDPQEARKLFDDLEPIDKLLGSVPPNLHQDGDELEEWAERALVFREPSHVLASLARLRHIEDDFGRGVDIESYRTRLKLHAARGELMRSAALAPESVARKLEIGPKYSGYLLYVAAESAFRADDDHLAVKRLELALPLAIELDPEVRRDAAAIAARLQRMDLAASFFDGLKAPTLAGREQSFGHEVMRRASRQIVTHAALCSRLDTGLLESLKPDSTLLAIYQTRLEVLGRLLGDGRRGRKPFVDPIQEFRDTLDFLQHAEGGAPHDSERWRITNAMDEAVASMVDASAALGPEIFARFVQEMDVRLETDPGRLGQAAVRRAYAMAVYRYEFDAGQAKRRLDFKLGVERTPAEQLAEAAQTASAFSVFGLKDQARVILTEMHDDGLGYSRAARKDPQYLIWRDLFAKACEEDPSCLRTLLRAIATSSSVVRIPI